MASCLLVSIRLSLFLYWQPITSPDPVHISL